MKIAVMAGTPVDTEFGKNLLFENGYKNVAAIAISDNPTQQTIFQTSSQEIKNEILSNHIERLKEENYKVLVVYCNSLSASVDFSELAERFDIKIITPLDIYRELAITYKKVAVLAANAQGLAGIEKVMVDANPNLQTIGITLLEMVKAIEEKIEPSKIAKDFKFKELASYISLNKVDVLILGCTHFPYIEKELERYSDVVILNPANRIIEKIGEFINE